MQDAVNGIGIIKSALPALINGFSTLMECVFQFLINVKPTLKMVTVLSVSRDTILRKDSASSLTSIMPDLLISDAEPGIGITKSVLPVPTNGFSMLMEYAFQFLTNAKLTLKTEIVPNASRVMT